MSWEKVKLKTVANISAGQSAPKDHDFNIQTGLPFIRAGHLEKLIENANIIELPKISKDNALKNRLKALNKGSILFAKSGMSAMMNRVYLVDQDAYYVSHLASVTPYNEVLDSGFCYYFLMHFKTSKLIKDSSYPSIGLPDIENLEIPLPPLATQKRIAEILDAADSLRRKDQELLKKYDELAQAIFIDMFGDPVKNEKGWEVKKLGDEFESIRYGTGSPPVYSDQGIPFIRATNIKAGRIEKKGMVFLSEMEAQKISKCFVNEGDLIIVRSGANTGDCAFISKEYENCLGGYDLIIKMDKVKSRFYNFFINSIWGKGIIDKLSRRAGQPHLNSEQVSNIECIAPNYSLLEKFKSEIEIIENSRKQIIDTNQLNQNLFQTLIQKAFKGELAS